MACQEWFSDHFGTGFNPKTTRSSAVLDGVWDKKGRFEELSVGCLAVRAGSRPHGLANLGAELLKARVYEMSFM